MGCVFQQIRAECGERGGVGDEMANCNRRPFYLVRVMGVANGGKSESSEAGRSRKKNNRNKQSRS
jgi:hypothetical protein